MIVVIAGYSLARAGGDVDRGPISVPNGDVPQAESSLAAAGYPVLVASDAPERLIPDTIFPDPPSTLIWFQGRNTNPGQGDTRVALDGAGGILAFDENLEVGFVRIDLEGRQVASVTAGPEEGYWVVTETGELMRSGADLVATELGFAPFDYTSITSGAGGDAWAYRSSVQFTARYRPLSGAVALKLSADGTPVDSVGSILVPADFMLAQLANSGHVALGDGVAFYAPFIRDEVMAISAHGDTLWLAKRELPQARDEPSFVPGELAIDYAPVNLGLAVGPDGLLYALSVPGFTVEESRIDVFDPATGRLLRSAVVDNPLPTISVDSEGRVYLIDEFRLMTGVPPAERIGLAPFELEVMDADRTMTNSDLTGKVTLINFWASWCAPCRTEMPALDSLRHDILHDDFQFLTFNEDVNPADGREFMEEYGFNFPVLLGRGQLRRKYHYMGLPFTLLIDREGNVVQRWIGFAGEDQIRSIRSVATAELERGVSLPAMDHNGGHEGGAEMSGMDAAANSEEPSMRSHIHNH
ncbi:MAG: redoxin domain-containing protein [Gemmatimonadales bacterium]